MPSQAMMERAAKVAASIIRNEPEDCGDLTLEIEAIASFGEGIERETREATRRIAREALSRMSAEDRQYFDLCDDAIAVALIRNQTTEGAGR